MSTTTLSPTGTRGVTGRWAPLPVVLAGVFMVVLDFFIVNVALPSMQSELHTGAGGIEWVVAGYSLTSAVFLIPGARLGDRHGRRRAFMLGMALFTLASAGCGFAGSPTELVIARLAQGAGGAIVMPTVLSLIAVLYDGADRARALSGYAMAMGLAAVGGQLIGGLLLAWNPAGATWRAVFLINLPIGALALAAAPRVLGGRGVDSGNESTPPLDPLGALLSCAAVTAVVLPLLQGRQDGWPLWTWLSLAAAVPLTGLFWARQRALANAGDEGRALVPPSLLALAPLRRSLVAQIAFWCGQGSFFVILALYLQQGRGLSPLDSGLIFTILAVSYVATSFAAPGLTQRHGRRVLGVGALVHATGHALLAVVAFALGTGGSVAALAPGLALVGAGMGLALPALATLILGSAGPEQAGAVSGVQSSAQNVGTALGVALIGVLFFGALHGGVAHAFGLCELVLCGLLVLVAALSRLLAPGVRS